LYNVEKKNKFVGGPSNSCDLDYLVFKLRGYRSTSYAKQFMESRKYLCWTLQIRKVFANALEIEKQEKIIQHVFFAAGILFTFASTLVKTAVESGLIISTMAMTSHLRLLEHKSMSMAAHEVTPHHTIFPHVKYY